MSSLREIGCIDTELTQNSTISYITFEGIPYTISWAEFAYETLPQLLKSSSDDALLHYCRVAIEHQCGQTLWQYFTLNTPSVEAILLNEYYIMAALQTDHLAEARVILSHYCTPSSLPTQWIPHLVALALHPRGNADSILHTFFEPFILQHPNHPALEAALYILKKVRPNDYNGYIEWLDRFAILEKSWRPQLLLAEIYLEAGMLEEMRDLVGYAFGLAPVEEEALGRMLKEIGRYGLPFDVLGFGLPLFQRGTPHYLVMLNLLEAYVQLQDGKRGLEFLSHIKEYLGTDVPEAIDLYTKELSKY